MRVLLTPNRTGYDKALAENVKGGFQSSSNIHTHKRLKKKWWSNFGDCEDFGVQWNHCLRTYCNKNFRGWIAGFNPFCQLIEIRTLGCPGILATGSYSPSTGINIPNIIKYWLFFFLNLVGRVPFFLPLTWAGTSNSCAAAKKTQGKLKLKPCMFHIHNARCLVGINLPTSHLLGWCSANWTIDSLASVSANLFCNVLIYSIFSYGCAAKNPFLQVLARVLFSPCCLCFGFAACRCVWGTISNLQNPHHVNPLRTNALRTRGYPVHNSHIFHL